MLTILPQLFLAGKAYDLAVSATDGSSITLDFLPVPGARSYEYALSSTSAVAGFGAWTALASNKNIAGLSSSTQYWVKVRSVNGVARGPSSPVVTGTTTSSTIDAAWLIARVSNIVAIWDADAGITKTGSNVTAWADQTSNGYVLGLNTPAGCAAPVSPVWGSTSYGGSKAGLTFTAASGEYLSTTAAAVAMGVSAFAFFMAANLTTNSQSYGRVISFVGNGQANDYNNSNSVAAILRSSTSGNLAAFEAGTAYGVYAADFGNNHRYGAVQTSTTHLHYLDNVQQSTDTVGMSLQATGQISVGNAAQDSSNAFMDGVVRRIVVMSADPSSGNRTDIDTFLTN